MIFIMQIKQIVYFRRSLIGDRCTERGRCTTLCVWGYHCTMWPLNYNNAPAQLLSIFFFYSVGDTHPLESRKSLTYDKEPCSMLPQICCKYSSLSRPLSFLGPKYHALTDEFFIIVWLKKSTTYAPVDPNLYETMKAWTFPPQIGYIKI